jgi:hypothetical protein
LRFLLARDPEVLTYVLGTVYRTIAGHIIKRARFSDGTLDKTDLGALVLTGENTYSATRESRPARCRSVMAVLPAAAR